MIDRIEREADRPQKPASPEMPRQAPPIDRTGTAMPGVTGDTPGVEADGFLTDWLASKLPI
ncbi:hypothetical protein ACIRPT_03030 [Streptomyces sp. NPDC101227]|uniref:hypothetical protein n=1 Tax=Streptomyces sp. NPDC101227 TaxID=3366136 RepID=UPI0037F9A709